MHFVGQPKHWRKLTKDTKDSRENIIDSFSKDFHK